MQSLNTLHTPVLLEEICSLTHLAPPGGYLDATVGYAGHASAILERTNLFLYGVDQDPFALECSAKRLAPFAGRFELISGNFREAFKSLKARGVALSELSFVLADIGVSSVQLDFAERGFGFDSPTLDMRMNPHAKLDAAEVLNNYSAEKLTQIFTDFGELPPRLAADIAAKITAARPFSSCAQLSALIGNAPLKGRKVQLKTLIFQAIRIEVNAELAALSEFLSECERLSGCVLAIISFHSLEDRLIKAAFKRFSGACTCPPEAVFCGCGARKLGRIITKKPITPSAAEIAANPRASCAKLRAFEFFERTNWR